MVIKIGPCVLVIGGSCPDPSVSFYLFTRIILVTQSTSTANQLRFLKTSGPLQSAELEYPYPYQLNKIPLPSEPPRHSKKNPSNAQKVVVYPKWDNISLSNFNISHPSKFLIHGYNGDMNLGPLMDIKTGNEILYQIKNKNTWMQGKIRIVQRSEYLLKGEHNIWAVNWPSMCEAPCYPMAAYNVRHIGECLANFIERLRRYHPLPDIHVIGFSLGAHVAAFAANHLRPYTLPRVTGLDPAMPLFMTTNKDHKLDSGDAKFVDVLHTNAFVQGKPDRCGHIDFYMNGGINQPGCFTHGNPIGCDHHRSLMYFAESINSPSGFWGWPCSGMMAYLRNECPPQGEAVLMGENVSDTAQGYFLVYTAASSPYALGKWTGGDTKRTRWQRLVNRRGGRREIETYLV